MISPAYYMYECIVVYVSNIPAPVHQKVDKVKTAKCKTIYWRNIRVWYVASADAREIASPTNHQLQSSHIEQEGKYYVD